MRARPAAALGLAAWTACQGHPDRSEPAAARGSAVASDAAAPDADLDGCRAALPRIASLAPAARAAALLEACQPCGDWKPLIDWNTLQTEGGPSRAEIERAMLACHAFCEPNAKQRFFGTLDNARGQATRQPWRLLGEVCKASVSAVPDARYMGGTYFALDRIARAIGGPAAAIALPLPAISITGVGVQLPPAPDAADATEPAMGAALTVEAAGFLLGALPSATLSADGLAIAGNYPGAPIEPAALAAALAQGPIAVLAPQGLAAGRIADAVAAAGGHEVRLAVGVPGPGNWVIPAALPTVLTAAPSVPAAPRLRLALDATGDAAIQAAQAASPADRRRLAIAVDATATTASLARLLAQLHTLEVSSVALVRAAANRSAPKP
jgi:hypothetical protein